MGLTELDEPPSGGSERLFVPSKKGGPKNDVEGVGLCVCVRVSDGV